MSPLVTGRARIVLAGLAAPLALLACKEQAPPAPSSTSLPPITIKDGSRMLFTYHSGGGAFKTVDAMNDVPQARRGWVRVVDLSVKPGKRRDHEMVYVADLRKARGDGTFPYVTVSRTAFEATAINRGEASAGAGPRAAEGEVILYATSWCGACRAARAYLEDKGIPFVEKDIEKDSAAAAELLKKARAAGISASGVPVLDVGGTLMQGFDAAKLDRLLGEKSK